MAKKKVTLKARNKLVVAETKRLSVLFKEIPKDKIEAVEGLIIQAARLRILLDEMWIDITEKGDYELFSQSERQDPYERERPVAKLYNSRDGAYQKVIKQLTDYLPDGVKVDLGIDKSGSDLV